MLEGPIKPKKQMSMDFRFWGIHGFTWLKKCKCNHIDHHENSKKIIFFPILWQILMVLGTFNVTTVTLTSKADKNNWNPPSKVNIERETNPGGQGQEAPKGPLPLASRICLPQTPTVTSSRIVSPKLTLSPSPRVDSNTLSPVLVFCPQYQHSAPPHQKWPGSLSLWISFWPWRLSLQISMTLFKILLIIW